MRTLMEFSAVATLAAVAIWLLRKQWQRFTTIAFVMGVMICALALPPTASAADIEHGDPSYTLPAGQEVKNDLIVWAARTRIDGDVDGDLIAFSDRVIVNGHVKGDVICFANELRVNGTVDGNVRSFTQSVTLSGSVGRNVTAWTGEFDLDQSAKIGGSLTLGATEAEMNGSVSGDLLVLGRTMEINGSLGRDARIRAQRLKIGPTAQILGRTRYSGWHQPEIESGAKVGPIDVSIKGPGPDYASARYYWHETLAWGASFIFGLVILLIAPGFFFDAAQACKRVGPAFGFGALFLFATPIAAILACLTIVGLGVGIASLLLYVIGFYAAQVFVGAWLGEQLLGAAVGVGPATGRLALGLAILHAIFMIPYLGPLVGLIAPMWGLGSIVLAFHRKTRPQLEPAA